MHSWLVGRNEDLVAVSQTDRYGQRLETIVNIRTGLVRHRTIPTDDEVRRFYETEYRRLYKRAELPRKRQIIRNLDGTADFIRRHSALIRDAREILDVGCGSGEFLYLMSGAGRRCVGIEPSRAYGEFCRRQFGLDVTVSSLDEIAMEGESFDFIRLNHVVEHLNDPVRSLRKIRDWLRPDGVLQLEVPDIESYCATKSRGKIFHFGHIYNFNPWTIRAVAELAGFREHEQAPDSLRASTTLFLRKAALPDADYVPENPRNGARVRQLLTEHAARGPRRNLLIKAAKKLQRNVSGILSAANSKTIVEIGEERRRLLGMAASRG